MTEEDKPIPSGRPRPGMETPKKKEEDTSQEERQNKGRSLAGVLLRDYRFWIFVVSFTLGFIAGRL